jgi:sulfate transport system substrate-binding protein
LITWENEAFEIVNGKNGENFSIIAPSVSLLIKLPVALANANINKHKNQEITYAYVDYLYSKKAQNIFAFYHFRPIDARVLERNQEKFIKINELINQENIGDAISVQQKHFAPGGIFDQIFQKPLPKN